MMHIKYQFNNSEHGNARNKPSSKAEWLNLWIFQSEIISTDRISNILILFRNPFSDTPASSTCPLLHFELIWPWYCHSNKCFICIILLTFAKLIRHCHNTIHIYIVSHGNETISTNRKSSNTPCKNVITQNWFLIGNNLVKADLQKGCHLHPLSPTECKLLHCKNSGVKFNTPGVVRGPHQVGVNFNTSRC